MGVAESSAPESGGPGPEPEQLGLLGSPAKGLGRGSSGPSLRFAGLSSTIRGHSHPTMREELEEGGEARQAPASYNSSSHYRVSHTAQAGEKLSNTQLESHTGSSCNPLLMYTMK